MKTLFDRAFRPFERDASDVQRRQDVKCALVMIKLNRLMDPRLRQKFLHTTSVVLKLRNLKIVGV